MPKFEIRLFDASGSELETRHPFATSETGMLAQAGRLARRNNGPVDIARHGPEDWSERYITTASPSEFHVRGYRFERLS